MGVAPHEKEELTVLTSPPPIPPPFYHITNSGEGCVHDGGKKPPDPMKPTHCPGQTDEEYRTEAATYAISASPMMIGTDIRLMTEVMNFTILNPELIGISQDPSGVAGFQTTSCGRPAWVRRLTEVGGSGARMAVAVPNLDDREAALVSGRSDLPTSPYLGLGKDSDVSVCLQDIGWVGDTAYAHDVWTHSSLGVINITTPLVRKLKSHDTVLIILSEHPLPTPPPTPTPPPSPHCSIALTKQTSRHECKMGSSYGCDDGAEKTMWVDGGCAGIFTCDGVANVACASQGEKRMTCKCAAAASVKELFVDPIHGSDSHADGLAARSSLRTVHAAAARVRTLLAATPGVDITVQLLPGTHHVGASTPLSLGPRDGGTHGGSVTWRSYYPHDPAVLGAPVRITGWKPHPTHPTAFSAPLPSNITKGTALRQFWVDGERATRPMLFGHGRQKGDNRDGFCLNLTNATSTTMYPEGSQFDFAGENATDPRTWSNPTDVEFVYTSCDAVNCWIEPRCTVSAVDKTTGLVSLHQEDNSSCFHRLYYYASCFHDLPVDVDYPRSRGRNPTHLENVESNWTLPGQFYYDRAQGSMGYIPRAGETVALLEATATTAVAETLLIVNGTSNLRWENVRFEYATWLGASGPRGYVDTQSGYLCQDGEPPANIKLEGVTNVTFSGCAFSHLGGVYALAAAGGSSAVVVSNSTFIDISGGGVKLGSAGERGAPAPNATLDPSEQDRGFLVTDSFFSGIPNEFSSANPIFAAYVADTTLAHNTIEDSRYSGICAGWGWGLTSYARNIRIENNSISRTMQLLNDGGGVYTNVVCPDCHVSRNYFESDPHVYGCLYHDGGSALWSDRDNVFNHIASAAVFCHGSCPGISVSPIYYNDSGTPNMQGATNNKLHDKNGVCVAPTIVALAPGAQWSGVAADVVANAGRRSAPLPPAVVPALSPPVNETANNLAKVGCVKFAARACDKSKPSQRWHLSPGVKAGDGKPTGMRSAVPRNASCVQASNCGVGTKLTCDFFLNSEASSGGSAQGLDANGCKPLVNVTEDSCGFNQGFTFNKNGTIALASRKGLKGLPLHHCMQVESDGSVGLAECQSPGGGVGDNNNPPASQVWTFVTNTDATVTMQQAGLCIDNNYSPFPAAE